MDERNPIWATIKAHRWLGDKEYLATVNKTGEKTHLTYEDLYREVQERRIWLAQQGVKAHHRVAVMIRHPHDFVLSFLAILSMHGVVVPVSADAPLDDAQRTLNLSGSDFLWRATATSFRDWSLDRVRGRGPAHTDGGGLILLTSGTTGDPKPVGLPISTLWGTAGEVARAHRIGPADRGFSPLPLFHINALVVAVLASLRVGSTVVLADQFHASNFWRVVDEMDITWINAVPSILMVLVSRPEGPQDPSRVRFVRSASAPLPRVTFEEVEARFGIGVVETYGLSEAASQVASNPLPAEGTRPGSVGLPRGIQIRIVNQLGLPLAPSEVGEVEVRGKNLIDPSWGPNHWAYQKMRDGWYQTGDLGYLDAEGFLFLEGRIRDLINRGGEKIFPREVEERLLAHPAIKDCAVVGRPHPLLGEEPVAFVVAVSGSDDVEQMADAWAREGLSRFKCPAAYFVVNSLPTGSTGKISRKALRLRVMEGGGSM